MTDTFRSRLAPFLEPEKALRALQSHSELGDRFRIADALADLTYQASQPDAPPEMVGAVQSLGSGIFGWLKSESLDGLTLWCQLLAAAGYLDEGHPLLTARA